MTDPHARRHFRLVLRDQGGPEDPDVAVRLRRLVKLAGRAFRLRVVDYGEFEPPAKGRMGEK